MPSAGSLQNEDLTYSLSIFRNVIRHGLAFQMTDRLAFGLRYNLTYRPNSDGSPFGSEGNYDRSLSLQYRLIDEGRYVPAIALGISDFLGTGRFESEYLVASKHLTDRIQVTGGIGWGRLATEGGFSNPLASISSSLKERGARSSSKTGGEIDSIEWFSGDAAFFGGISWWPTDQLRLTAEYSSDAYVEEQKSFGAIRVRSPYNFSLDYALGAGSTVRLAWLYGSELAVQYTYRFNPKNPRHPSGLEPSGPLVQARPAGFSAVAGWDMPSEQLPRLQRSTSAALAKQGIGLHGLSITGTGTSARVEIENRDWPEAAQALGRAARVLTATLPMEIEQFDIVLIERGIPISATSFSRNELEAQEFAYDGAWEMRIRSPSRDAGAGTAPLPDLYPRLSWGIDPYIATGLFDPDAPLRMDVGLDFSASWEPAPGLIVSGVVRAPVFGNLDQSTRSSSSVLPHVRSDAWLYDKADVALRRLTGAWYFRPGEDFYGRVTVGLLERMFGGVSAELLWYPTGSRIGFGAEISHVVQRDYDQAFSFRDYEVTTGHVSAYWDMGKGYHSQLDLGRYLAGDFGGTLTVRREFENGWSLGLFATLTDVSFDDFGEGSFDKGLMLTVPISWVTGKPTREAPRFVMRPLLRDGGARLDVDGRLHDTVRSGSEAELTDGWGRFWR